MHQSLKKFPRLLFVAAALCLLAGAVAPAPTAAQDGPVCPPGFHFERMSGVGCVQDNCASIPGARYSYTGTCICGDEFKGCYAPVDAPDFDFSLCGPFCPVSQLLSCISPEDACPDLSPAVESPPVPAEGIDLTGIPTLDDLLRDLEEFLIGEGLPISAGRSAAAAAAAPIHAPHLREQT